MWALRHGGMAAGGVAAATSAATQAQVRRCHYRTSRTSHAGDRSGGHKGANFHDWGDLKSLDSFTYHLRKHQSGDTRIDLDQLERGGDNDLIVRMKMQQFTPEDEVNMASTQRYREAKRMKTRLDMIERSAPQSALIRTRKMEAQQNRLLSVMKNNAKLMEWRGVTEAKRKMADAAPQTPKTHEQLLESLHPEFFQPVTGMPDTPRAMQERLTARASREMRTTGGLGRGTVRTMRQLEKKALNVGHSWATGTRSDRMSHTHQNHQRCPAMSTKKSGDGRKRRR
eukprot:Rhum_TRINITY_DN19522_c0_g1::Rhum_TRINITY_DN19522_c0_g1_i1::g.170195::m.170195